jgi:hypothetical protein
MPQIIKLLMAAIVLVAVSFMVGRHNAPVKTVTKVEEKIVVKEVIKWKEKKVKDENKNKETVIVETVYPDGTIKRETRIIDKGTIKVAVEKEGSKSSEKTTTVSKEQLQVSDNKQWNVSVLAGTDKLSYNDLKLDYGLHVQKTILGPFSLGAFGLTNGSVGLSVGGSF